MRSIDVSMSDSRTAGLNIVGGLFAVLALTGCNASNEQVTVEILPQNTVQPPAILRSEVETGSVRQNFEVRNKSGRDIVLELSGVSCSCANIFCGDQPWKVGDSRTLATGNCLNVAMTVDVRERFNSASCTLAARAGDVTQTKRLKLSQFVLPDAWSIPSVIRTSFASKDEPVGEFFVRFQERMRPGQPQPTEPPGILVPQAWSLSEMTLESEEQDDFTILSWKASLRVEWPRFLGGEESASSRMKVSRVGSNGVNLYEYAVPLVVEQKDGLICPQRIQLNGLTGKELLRKFRIHSADGKTFQLRNIESNGLPATLNVAWNPDRSAQKWIKLVYEPDAEQSVRGSLTFTTDVPGFEEFDVEVECRSVSGG